MLVLHGQRFLVLEARNRNSLLWRFSVMMSVVLTVLVVGIYPSLAEAAVSGSTISSSTTTQKQPPQGSFPLQATTRDPFVEASPLVVGVICRDGVLLLALHSIFSESNDESSLLLVRQECKPSTPDNSDNGKSEDKLSPPPLLENMDLPESYRGPFRIHALDDSGSTAMVCAGWRTDCGVLADHLCSIDQSETFVFGSHRPLHSKSLAANKNTNAKNMGGVLADKASLFLARRSVSERTRPLACAGLLASASISSTSSSTSTPAGGFLWVVDATGAYAVRAHALGRGSEKANEILRSKDWTKLESSAVQTELLRLLLQTTKSASDAKSDANVNSDDGSDNDKKNQSIELPKGSRFEMAIVESSPADRNTQRKKMKRLFASI
jgi:20S proteasome alpha/beta subunit